MKLTNEELAFGCIISESESQTAAALSQREITNVWELLEYEMLKTSNAKCEPQKYICSICENRIESSIVQNGRYNLKGPVMTR